MAEQSLPKVVKDKDGDFTDPLTSTPPPPPGGQSDRELSPPLRSHTDPGIDAEEDEEPFTELGLDSSGPVVIMNGLKLSLPKQQHPIATFDYALTPFMEESVPVPEKVLVTEEVEGQHIRCHELQQGQNLPELISNCQNSDAKAMILINTEDTHVLNSEFLVGAKEKGKFPVLLLTKSDGSSLMKALDRHENEDVFAKVDAENEVDVVTQRPGEESLGKRQHSLKTASGEHTKEGPGVGTRLLKAFGLDRKPSIDLKGEMKKLIFSSVEPGIVSEDAGKFSFAMAVFSNYEKIAKTEAAHADVSELLKKLLKHLPAVFPKDFPFYILLAYRMHIKMALYQCDELGQFIRTCIELMERLRREQLAQVFNVFIKRGDFSIMFLQDVPSSGVFELLENACLEMAQVSYQIGRRSVTSSQRLVLYPGFLHSRMMWVSLALRLHSERGTVTRSVRKLWSDKLLIYQPYIVLDQATCVELKEELEFGDMVHLQAELTFGPNHLVQLLASDKCCRPFEHVKNFINTIENFLLAESEFYHFVVTLRSVYTSWLKQDGTAKLKAISLQGTLAGALEEGLSFLDMLHDIWTHRNFNPDMFDSECVHWLKLLLQLIDITGDNPHLHLKRFITGRTKVCKNYRKEIVNYVVAETRQKFDKLSVQQFYPLLKAFRIWSKTFLESYLKAYKLPPGIRIKEPTWSVFMNELVSRFGDHRYLLNFLKSIAEYYRLEKRAQEFIMDLLLLEVPKLFAVEPGELEEDARAVAAEFTSFLYDYINRNTLKPAILTLLTLIMTSITEKRNEFQQLVLSVLQREIIPESKALQGTTSITNNNLHSALQLTVLHLRGDLSWLQDLTTKQRFCWGLVAACCAKIPIAQDNFDWVHSYSYVISQLGRLFTTYCTARKLGEEEKVLSKVFPQEITHSRSDDVRKYFDWVKRIQDVLIFWQDKFFHQKINFDELLSYACSNIPLAALGNTLSSMSLVVDYQEVQQLKNAILQDFELANILLLKYIPGQPDANWCTLPSLLAEYGVCLPLKISQLVSKHMLFPGETKQIFGEILENPLPPATTGTFQPVHDISLTLTKNVCLHTLSGLVKSLQAFLQPLMEDLDMLVFFKLLRSVMFDKYLRLQIKKTSVESITPASLASTTSVPLSVFGFSFPVYSVIKPEGETCDQLPIDGLPLQVLVKSLNRTKKLLFQIMNGKAKYFEIIAEGELNLETLDIEREFSTLASFSTFLQADRTGLNGVRSLLELFQYTIHIQNISEVCSQYHLEVCLQDPGLKELNDLVQELRSDESRSNLTPLVATEKMKRVRKLLYLDEKKSSKCLDLFAAIQNSAAFYQFVRDKSFVGMKGQARFRELHQLITAQLQHEEYDETVLNHLYAAFRFIGPFMDTKQKLQTLMSQVTALDATDGMKQLETVNGNITLIRLWFSRAEGDTLENVAQDLDCIMRTGFYLFHLTQDTGEGEAEIFLEYSPSSSSQQPLSFPSQPSSLEDRDAKPVSHILARLESRSGSEDVVRRAPKAERWNFEQINDFVRKLGFLDTETEQGEAIKNFLHINEIAYRLLELYMRLRELGHPDFLKGVLTESLPCTVEQFEADKRVKDTEQQLTTWTQQVASLRSQYDWLLFFSVPKLLTLYKLVSEDPLQHLDCIVHEISFLCHNDETARDIVRALVEKSLPSCVKEIAAGSTPMKVVGRFLGLLFNNHTLPHRCGEGLHPRRSSMSSFSIFIDATQQLHVCHGYTQGQLMQVIVGIYDGVPEAFEVFHCCPSSTEEELRLFLSRTGKHPLKFLVLEVNRLPYKLQEYLMQLKLMVTKQQEQEAAAGSPRASTPTRTLTPCIHFIETAPSMLREIPGIQQREHKEPPIKFEKTRKICLNKISKPEDFVCIQLVYGYAGDGKTHYIKQQLASSPASLTIAVSEAFTPLSAIKKLRSLPVTQKDCAIFFNFTMLPPGVSAHVSKDSAEDKWYAQYMKLMEVIGWFFFDLLVLGYVEDRETGLSFRIPGGLQWAIYIEVPSRDRSKSPSEALKLFKDEVPALALLGTQHYISPDTPYSVDKDVKLVCNYLKALRIGGKKGIDRLFREVWLVKFSQDTITAEECHALLMEYMPDHIRNTKITQRLFIKYMKRRCAFLDSLPSFNYNTGAGEYIMNEQGVMVTTDTTHLGSTLMNTMLSEVSDFCDPAIKENWSIKPHQQLIYDFKDGGASLGLITLHPEKLPEPDKAKFKRIGVKIPSMTDLYDRKLLDGYLSRALNVELENDRLTPIDDSAYVLTIDYTIKMLNIHERYECGVPVIIEGETGVGKTALVEMLSKLWNHSLLLAWKRQRNRLLEFFQKKLGDIPTDISENYPACVQSVEAMSSGDPVKEKDLLILCQLPDSKYGKLYKQLKQYLQPMKDDPVLALLTLSDTLSKQEMSFEDLFIRAQIDESPEATASLLNAVLTAQIIPTFHKINVHAAMTPCNIASLFKPVFEQARSLKQAYNKQTESALRKMSVGSKEAAESSLRIPFVTVFLDEVNTSSCLGLFKEIIVDRTFDGEPIPDNVFIVAACNPHRGNSIATLANRGEKETWMRGTYYVRSLHPTLHFLMWDYGSLSTHQERDYINAKMKMLNRQMPNAEVGSLTDLIVVCQNLMRDYAKKHLTICNVPAKDAEISSRSCVSQRDIQRVFTIYQWFMSTYTKLNPYGERNDYCRRAVLVSLGIVYYMRLNNNFRKDFSNYLDSENRLPGEVSFTKALEEELNWYMERVDLPAGIAKTQALKENLFATIVCCINHIPLIIVGAPGSSKTLSFNQAIANLKGQESKVNLFRDTDIFPSLDPHYYQCSRRTTSNEVETVFSRAVNRQRSHRKFKLPIYCVVFMDEAGLPEESHESLKVLHYHLDKQEVSFVAITNHVLDAAKTNRAISLFRPEASDDDLETLAKGCLCSKPTPELESDLNTIVKFCAPYSKLMNKAVYHKEFRRFFGLRDFIHFVNYLRRKRLNQGITPQLVMESLERNFNGSEQFFTTICVEFLKMVSSKSLCDFNGSEQFFTTICVEFLKMMGSHPDQVNQRGILAILEDSLRDRPQQSIAELERDQFRDAKPEVRDQRSENEVRYKLIIDPSEDDSIVRLLFSFGILQRDKTRMFVCSDFPGDSQLQKINTIAAIRHSAIEGHTVVMSQTDDIHESFYDLFNQRFRMIDDPKEGTRYYTNIAIGAHLKPCRVHPNFQCVIVVKKSEVKDTPAPFLNRFEKYYISHSNLLDTALRHMPYCMRTIVENSKKKVQKFIDCISAGSSLYGFKPETLDSLLLSILPSFDHTYQPLGEPSVVDDTLDVRVYLMQEFLQALRHSAGFNIPPYPLDELSQDTEHIFALILNDPEFDGLMPELNHNQAILSVTEAMNNLHAFTAPQDDYDQQHNLNPEVCMVIALFQQWLVRYLCKRLMQLMTSEALTLHRNKLPYSYLENYLVNHSHFSLKELICNHYNTLHASEKDCTSCPTKLLCFTRSSPLIHQLPNMHPSTVFDTQAVADAKQVLQDLVFDETNKLVACKLSGLLSQSFIQELLKGFARSDSTEVCLLVANMQETSKQVVNHIRIMIEEIEALYPRGKKLYVLLLHFPPAQFFDACYPSLFLKGWDHCYLDTIAHRAVKGVVDIQDWFWQCCFPNQARDGSLESDSLIQALKEILPQAIPVLTSRVYFGSKEGRSFNCPMNGSQRSQALRELLFDRGVGDILCEKFRGYWKPSVMVEVLKRAAMFNKNFESTLNITDTIQTHFKVLFFDFLVYMLSRMNENYNLDLLFDADCTPAVQLLFIDILRVFPTPKLSQISVLSANLPTPIPLTHTPRFPFFKLVYTSMESIVEQSHDETNVKVNILNEEKSIAAYDSIGQVAEMEHDRTSLLTMVHKIVTAKLQDINKAKTKDPVLLAIEAIALHGELWRRYFTEFNLHKLHLESPSEGIAQQILYAYFGSLHQQEAMVKVVGLHSYVFVYHLDLAKLATILRPLDKVQKMHLTAKAEPHVLTSPLSTSPSQRLMSSMRQSSHPLGSPEHLATFVINALFNTVIGCLYQPTDSSSAFMPKFKLWFKAYRDVLILPTLKQYIYHAIQSKGSSELLLVEARLNLMHVTFLALQTSPVLDDSLLQKGRIIFQTLFSRHFSEAMELKTECPRLADITSVAVEIISDAEFSPSLHRDNHRVRLIMEGLFAHFFCAERQSYHRDDVQWFLELANEQMQWKSCSFEHLVVSGSLSEDLVSKMEKSTEVREYQRQSSNRVEVPKGTISMSIFKLYLVRVLGVCDRTFDEDLNRAGPLLLYNHRSRLQVGELLCASPELGPPVPYIPIFYQECPPIVAGENSKSLRMQQPLAHLYFLTVLEHLVCSQLRLAGLVRTADVIRKDFENRSSTLSEPEQVLMWIELQALIQVVAQKLAENLDPSSPHKMGEVQPIVDDINFLLSTEALGGGKAQGHGMVVALHMLKLLKSTRRFSELMTKKYDSICRGVDCLKPFHDQLKSPVAVPKPHLFPFLYDGAGGELHSLYVRVRKVMVGIHENKAQLNELVQIADECAHSVRISPVNPVHSILESIVSGGKKKQEIQIDKRLCFRMLVWLVAYYEFYDKKISSQLLCNVFGGTEMAPFLHEEGYIRLIQTFLFPPLMINKPESPNPVRDDEVVLELTPEGHHRPVRRGGPNDVDPLYQLFVPEHPEKQDQSDVDLRHSLANLVAIVLGCPSRSNHLWYHLFASDELKGTYLTGFMYDSKIKPEGLLYDCGVELTPDGQLGRQDYKKHANRGTYTLHSLYFLLWANFGSFCISLLTQPDADSKIHGPIISEWLSVRHYCVSQLRTMWLHMRNNLGLSDEERSFFVMRLMWRFCELTFAPHDTLLSPQLVAMGTIKMDSLRGVFHTRGELDGYEKMWHKLIYQHTLSQLKTKFTQYSQYWQNIKLLEDLKRLECRYPYFARELDFTHSVVGHVDPSQSSHYRGELRLLSHFATEWCRLQAGGLLLPDLLEFYMWIHTSLAHLVTYEKATSLPIGRVIELASKRYKGDHLSALYERVKVGYNSYVELIGGAIGVGACAAVRQGNKIYTIADDIPLLHFLSDVAEEEEGNDWLFTVIEDIITGHNMFIEGLYSALHAQQDSPLARLLSDEPAKIFPSETDQYNCIVGNFKSLHGINDFLQLIRSRYQPPQTSPLQQNQMSLSESILHMKLRPIFQMSQLEEDVVVTFIAGKPLIGSAAPFRTPFKFRQAPRAHEPSVADVVHSDLSDIKGKLSLQFQVPLEDALRKRIEYEFHSAGYHTMVAVVTGLKTVVGHLVKSLEQSINYLEEQTVSEFMLKLYELNKSSKVLAEIGITTLTPSQVACLSELPLPSLWCCLEMFASWVDEGLYDFSSLPFPLKTHMSEEDQLAVENELRGRWVGSLSQLLEEVMQMNDILKHSETHITKVINEASQKPIVEYLKDNHYFDDQDKLPDLVPQTILLQHYVSFRLALRRLVLKVRKEVKGEATPEDGDVGAEQWHEFVDSLWDEALPHLRPQVYDDDAFVFDPYTGKYGFQEGSEFDSENELMDDLMNEPGLNEEGEQGVEDSFAEIREDKAAGHSYDLGQPSSEEDDDDDDENEKDSAKSNPSHQEDELEKRFKHDSEFQKKVLSMAKTLQRGVVSLEQEARKYTPEKVAEFLTSIGMERHAQKFIDDDISGEILLEADNESLLELGVSSAVNRLQLQVLFKRALQTGLAKYPVSEVVDFLEKNKLGKYKDAFELNGIDGDMILEAEDRFFNEVMQEIGIASAVDRLKIRSKFKSYISGQ